MFLKIKLKWLWEKRLFLTSTIPCCCICAFCNLGSKSLRYVMMNQSSPQHSLSTDIWFSLNSDFWRKQKKVTIHLSPNFSPKPYQTFSTSITERVVLSTFFVTAALQNVSRERRTTMRRVDEERRHIMRKTKTALKVSKGWERAFGNPSWSFQTQIGFFLPMESESNRKKAFWIQDIESIWF